MDKQHTIARETDIDGIGLHSGKKVHLRFKPAPEDYGIVFIRTDIAGCPQIRVSVENSIAKSGSPRRTSIGKDDIELFTVEHLMSALFGMKIDNLIVEIDNEEVPGLDGSSIGFIEILEKAGIQEQTRSVQPYIIKEPVVISEDGSTIIALPSDEFKVSYTLDYRHSFLRTEFVELVITPETFRKEIAPARTFCLESEVQQLQCQGLGKGANYSNTLVVGEKGVIGNKLRFEDEFVRHKILDLIGDLRLLGNHLKMHIIALRSGHSLNVKLVRKIAQQRGRSISAGIVSNYQIPDGGELDIEEIKKILPHRDPFLFVDRVIALEPGKRAVGIKNVNIDDYFFKGHFPGRPVMPGVLILEAMAQVGGVMMLSPAENRGKLAFFMAADNIKFRKTVLPGDQLVMEVVAGKIRSKTGQVHAKAYVDDKVAVEADFMFILAK
ncbi:MAG: bifunctional UDP-3-O-[3-hydroxymyristoyl] N-acetylglucosamine deacetylase/3-hydroxyacyl-ACP dehydratase [Candidatus Omnitrophica bacterium]|nr:bifunctional UDP-3-O-[3-hydroxymyristoyl] N-acetylglucosamine deacetylase/3-hydroxyacyl-ACP dehydratase [Candidatus Omnitrophota bacterium]